MPPYVPHVKHVANTMTFTSSATLREEHADLYEWEVAKYGTTIKKKVGIECFT